MEPDIVSQIVIGTATVVAALGGFVVAGVNDSFRDKRAAKRELENHRTRRQEERTDRSEAFQLENLLALQDALQIVARLNGKALHFDHMQARQSQYTRLPEELSEELFDNEVNLRRLGTRVLNEEIRTKIEAFLQFMGAQTNLPEELKTLQGEQLEAFVAQRRTQMHQQYRETTEPLGREIRALLAE